jgi:osmotically-inducible protein OsmY
VHRALYRRKLMEHKGTRSTWFQTAALCALISALPLAAQQGGASDTKLQADVQKALRGKQYRQVQSQVQNGVVTLTGSVDLFAAKAELEKRIDRLHEATSVDDRVTIRVPEGVTDQQLFNKLGRSLTYDRQGFDSTAFTNITLNIRDGMVEIGGLVPDPSDKDYYLGLVTNTPGVRGVVDHIQVAPVSPNDWRLRRALFQAVYGAPQLNRYALDPAKPIRILVVNGRCTLVGVVQNRGDRDVAGISANGVPGVFAVTNNLQVQGERQEQVR